MALLPSWSELADDFFRPHNPWNWNNFGSDIYPHELDIFTSPRSLFDHYISKYHRLSSLFSEFRNIFDFDSAETRIGKDGFQVRVNVKDFVPNEISVKTVDNVIVIEAKHEERKDGHGYISRQFRRRYVIPREFKMENVITELSSDGILNIKVSRDYNAKDDGNVRVLKIHQTGPARLRTGNVNE